MTNAAICELFAKVFTESPSLTGQYLEELLAKQGYSVTITKNQAVVERDAHLYQFPFMTGERSVATL